MTDTQQISDGFNEFFFFFSRCLTETHNQVTDEVNYSCACPLEHLSFHQEDVFHQVLNFRFKEGQWPRRDADGISEVICRVDVLLFSNYFRTLFTYSFPSTRLTLRCYSRVQKWKSPASKQLSPCIPDIFMLKAHGARNSKTHY